MRKVIVLGALVLVAVLAAAGCGSSSGGDTSGSASGGDTSGSASGDGSPATITLPDGWAMTDALGAEEVGALTGKTMEAFPEGSSAAQDGKPAGGYTAAGVDGSKIYFGVDVQGGEAGYESMLSYAEPGSTQEVSGVGDKAAVVAFSDGRAGIIVLKGDAVIRVDWDPQVYPDDPADFGPRLANALLAKMYE